MKPDPLIATSGASVDLDDAFMNEILFYDMYNESWEKKAIKESASTQDRFSYTAL